MSRRIAGYVGSPQPHSYRHDVTLTDSADLPGLTIYLMPAYGFWRAKAHWMDADGREQIVALTDVVTWDAPCEEDPMGHRLYMHAVIPDRE